MLLELIIAISIFVCSLGIAYPSLLSIKANVDEQSQINLTIQQHEDNLNKAQLLDGPTKIDSVVYYPNRNHQPYTIYTRKHQIIFGKYNTLQIRRK